MNFSDGITRDYLQIVFVKRTEKEFEARDEYNSNFWDVEKHHISLDKETRSKVHLYSTPARDIKIGENIYDKSGKFVAYRSN